MKTPANSLKKKNFKKNPALDIRNFFYGCLCGCSFAYYNLNTLLTAALIKSFNSNIISDVYELKFEKLSVNFLMGNVKVYNV